AAMALEVDEQTARAGPAGERFDQAGEQHVVDLGVIDARHLLEEEPGLLLVQPHGHRALESDRVLATGMVHRERRHPAPGWRRPVAHLLTHLVRAQARRE